MPRPKAHRTQSLQYSGCRTKYVLWRGILLAACGFVLACLPGTGRAANNNWVGPATGDWTVGTNWSLGLPPEISDDVTITGPGVHVALDESSGFNSLAVSVGNTVTVETATVGQSGLGSLTGIVNNGTVELHPNTYVHLDSGQLLNNATGVLQLDSTSLEGNLVNYGTVNCLSSPLGTTFFSVGDIENHGNFSVASSATVFLSPDVDLQQFAGQLVVSGDLRIDPSAMLSLQGGTLTVNPFGTLIGRVQQNGGTLQLPTDQIYWQHEYVSGVISPSGSVLYVGSGTLDLFTSLNLGAGRALDMSNSGRVTLRNGATLTAPSGVYSDATGTLSGNGTIVGNVTSGGKVAPGLSPGTITINGDYYQNTTSVLEIEVGGLTPGTQHDQVIVSGTATLDGTYIFPIINNFVPQANESITFLTAGTIASGSAPTTVFSPGLDAADPNLAVSVVPGATSVELHFVPKRTGTTLTETVDSNWFTGTWSIGQTPTSIDVTTVTNNKTDNSPQVVTVSTMAGTSNATVRDLLVADTAGDITVRVVTGSSLAATTGDVTIATRGTLELGGGSVAVASTQAIHLTETGTFRGSGTIDGTVKVGIALATSGATFSPGLTTLGSEVGAITIQKDYRQADSGILAINITGNNSGGNHDTISVAGDTDLSGVIRVDLSGLTNPEFTPGNSYEIASVGGNLTGKFDRVEVVGRSDIYFEVEYDNTAPAAGAGGPGSLASGQSVTGKGVSLTGYFMGDATQDGVVDQLDAQVLAAVLLDNSLSYYICDAGACFAAANFLDAFDFADTTPDASRVVDFYDLPEFAEALAQGQGMSYAAAAAIVESEIQRAINRANVPEPGALAGVLWIIGASVLGGRRLR